jgi:hypothetical protein
MSTSRYVRYDTRRLQVARAASVLLLLAEKLRPRPDLGKGTTSVVPQTRKQRRLQPLRSAVARRICFSAGGIAVLSAALATGQVRVIEVLADKDSRYKIAGEKQPEITVKAGEAIVLRITARRGKSWNRDGSIHGFSLLRAADRSKVPGWDLSLKAGVNEFQMAAPSEPGLYEVVCTVVCSEYHEGMHMKFVVLP